MEKKIIFDKFTEFLRDLSFKKYGSLWGKVCNEYLLVLYLRKSQWANKYYLEIGGICSHDKHQDFSKKAKDIDFIISVDKLVPELDSVILDSALDLEASDDAKLERLLRELNRYLIPYLENLSTKEGVKKLYADGNLKAAMIDARAREVLNL